MAETSAVPSTDTSVRENSPALYEKAPEMEFHPLSKLFFPLLSGEELKALADDIAVRGLLEPITTHEGMILEGRNRYQACRLAGVQPRFEEYVGDDPLGFVLAKNLARRHLTTSQRALIAAKLETHGHGGDRQDAILHLVISRSNAAGMMRVSERSVASAKVVLRDGPSHLIEAVGRGEITISEAEAQINKAARRGKAKATTEDAADQVTGEQSQTRDKRSKRGPSYTEAEREAGHKFLDRLVELSDPSQHAELEELAEQAAPYYGQFCRDFVNRVHAM